MFDNGFDAAELLSFDDDYPKEFAFLKTLEQSLCCSICDEPFNGKFSCGIPTLLLALFQWLKCRMNNSIFHYLVSGVSFSAQ
jgi:hypothetical protein